MNMDGTTMEHKAPMKNDYSVAYEWTDSETR